MSTTLPSRFIPHSVKLATHGGVAAWINQIENYSWDDSVSLFEESSGSQTDREFVATREVNPTMPIMTSDLTFLSTCGMSGVYISPDISNPGLTAYGRELPQGALPTAIGTGNHLSMLCSDGLLVPLNLRAAHNQKAMLSLMLHGILGTTVTYSQATPFVFSQSQVIAAGAGAFLNLFTAGVFKFNSRLVVGIEDINIDFGLNVFKESKSGLVYPEYVSIIGRMPRIEFSTRDLGLQTEVGDGISVTSAVAYLRQVAQNGQRTPLATTSHVSVGGTAGMITPGALSLGHKQPGTAHFTYTPSLNSSILTISTAAAIPAS